MGIDTWARATALGGLAGLTVGAAAQAQSSAAATQYSIVDTPSVADAPSHYSINATGEAQYQSNVAGGSAAVAALRGLKQSDVIFSPTLAIDLFKPFGRESVFLTGTVGYNFYNQNSKLNREALDLSGGVNGRLGSCRATVTGGYVRRQDELQDITGGRVQDVYDQASVGLEGACGASIGLSPNFSVSQTWSNNSLALFQSSNYSTIGGSAGVTYQAPSFGALSFFGQYQSTDFTNRLLMVNQGEVRDGYDDYGGGVRYVRLLGARIQGTVSVSYTSVKPFVGSSGFDGPTYSADVTFRASSRLTLHGNVIRDVQPSNVFDSEYFLETKGLVEVNYAVGSRLTAIVGASEQDRTFKGPAILPTLDLKDDSLKTIYLTLTYSLRRAFVTLDVRNDQRSANLAGLSYPNTRVGLTVGTRF